MLRNITDLSLTPTEIQTLITFFPEGIVAFDLETTGLSPIVDKIIEIAAVKLNSKGETETMQFLINPLITIPTETIKYHEITNDMVRDKPTLRRPLEEFLQFIADTPLLAHNGQFDAGFVVKAKHDFQIPMGKNKIFDSCKMARAVFKKKSFPQEAVKPEDFKLSTLAIFYQIDLKHHQALSDSFVCLKVMARLLAIYSKEQTTELVKEKALLFSLAAFKKLKNYGLNKKQSPLIEMTSTQTPIKIAYRGGTKGLESRPVKPIAILPMPQGLILYAQCLLENYNKSFLISRITSIEKMES
jgi:DNA polymerase III epsilon subunit family exonuclease